MSPCPATCGGPIAWHCRLACCKGKTDSTVVPRPEDQLSVVSFTVISASRTLHWFRSLGSEDRWQATDLHNPQSMHHHS